MNAPKSKPSHLTAKLFPVIGAENAAALVAQIENTQRYRKQYDFTRRFTATAGKTGTAEINMPSEGDFQILGYNIEYDAQANGAETILLKFHQQDGGKNWSNDYVPIRSIATPGVRQSSASVPGIRYGYREFTAFVRKNDKIAIDFDNTLGLNDSQVFVTFTGYIWTNATK